MVDRVKAVMLGQCVHETDANEYLPRVNTDDYEQHSHQVYLGSRVVSPWSYTPEDYDPPDHTDKTFFNGLNGRADPPRALPPAEVGRRLTYEGPVTFEPAQSGTANNALSRPLNPRGRTGLRGRGRLCFWGPNHAVDVLLTRFHPVTHHLQLALVQPFVANRGRGLLNEIQGRRVSRTGAETRCSRLSHTIITAMATTEESLSRVGQRVRATVWATKVKRDSRERRASALGVGGSQHGSLMTQSGHLVSRRSFNHSTKKTGAWCFPRKMLDDRLADGASSEAMDILLKDGAMASSRSRRALVTFAHQVPSTTRPSPSHHASPFQPRFPG